MIARKKKEMKPLMLKVGVALALSLAGFLYSRLRTRRIGSKSTTSPSSETDSRGIECGRKDEIHASQIASCSSSPTEKYQIDNTIVGLSLPDNHNGDKDGTLLPEFDDLVKEVDFPETPKSTPKTVISVKEEDDYEKEVKHLKNIVRILTERERNLEVQLLEYYGLKEQEKTVMELENRLKISNMEAKLLRVKIESLQANNQRLEAQLADHAEVVTELEAARGKIKLMKRKLRHEAEQNREHILSLQERVAKMRDQAGGSDPEVQSKLERINELENEAKELRSDNLRLQLENADLGKRLDATQILAVTEDSEATELKQITNNLKEENENLAKKIETLEASQCGDIEELVYLRWLNACLRFEMRNYHPPSGKTVARDLCMKLSPRSEEKAKQLILEYAGSEDFNSDRWSNTEFDFSDGSTVDTQVSGGKSRSRKHRRLFKKLKNLIKGKDNDHHHSSNHDHRMDDSDSSMYSTTTSDQAQSSRFTSPPPRIRTMPDIPRFRSHNVEQDSKDSESGNINKSYGFNRRASIDLGTELEHHQEFGAERGSLELEKELEHHREFVAEKADLVKYAQALKGRTRRRSASYNSLTF